MNRVSWGPKSHKLPFKSLADFFDKSDISRMGYRKALSLLAHPFIGKPTLITDREWDVLIILDACRLDLFRTVYPDSTSIISPGSATMEWVIANFISNPAASSLRDVMMITANIYSSKEYFDMRGWAYPFGDCISVWKNGWDDELDTVPPERIPEACEDIPSNQRVLIHFLQPHAPYIAPPLMKHTEVKDAHGIADATWRQIKDGTIDREVAMAAYESNFRMVLKAAISLIPKLEGKIVLTSDHGELFGEYGLYSHAEGVRVPELVTVPWLEIS